MKQLIARMFCALTLISSLALCAPKVQAQVPGGATGAPGAPQMSEAEQKEMAEFQKKAMAIQEKYKSQIDAIQKKHQPELDKIQAKYKPKMEALQKEGLALKPEEKKGEKGKAIQKKMQDLRTQMTAEPGMKKFATEMKPVAKKAAAELLEVAPAKLKPQLKKLIEMQMATLGS